MYVEVITRRDPSAQKTALKYRISDDAGGVFVLFFCSDAAAVGVHCNNSRESKQIPNRYITLLRIVDRFLSRFFDYYYVLRSVSNTIYRCAAVTRVRGESVMPSGMLRIIVRVAVYLSWQ